MIKPFIILLLVVACSQFKAYTPVSALRATEKTWRTKNEDFLADYWKADSVSSGSSRHFTSLSGSGEVTIHKSASAWSDMVVWLKENLTPAQIISIFPSPDWKTKGWEEIVAGHAITHYKTYYSDMQNIYFTVDSDQVGFIHFHPKPSDTDLKGLIF